MKTITVKAAAQIILWGTPTLEFYSLEQTMIIASAGREKALREAAAIARANTSAPRIWQDGAWHNPHGEEIAVKIEELIRLS